jgi:hypothetical protein
METDMDRLIKDRDIISREIEKCNAKLADAADVSDSLDISCDQNAPV